MSALIALVIWFFAWPFVSMWRSYVVIVLWGWFVFPLTGIVPPSIYLVTGAMMALHLILPFKRHPKDDEDPLVAVLTSLVTYGLLAPALVLGCGWIWKWLQWGVA